MNFFDKLLIFLQRKMIKPVAFGWFHLVWLFVVLISIFILYKRKKYYNEWQLKMTIGIYGFVALVLELLKQIIWTFNYDISTNIITSDYNWYAFPFQLCTTPIYISLICLMLKKCKVRDYLLSYLSYITILGSISTMLIPESCFVEDILVNIHTMWLHLGSFVVSVYLLMMEEVKLNIKSLKNGIIVFLIFVVIANILNICVYNSGILNGETFNMFYISPYFVSSLPVFNIIQENVPYILFLIVYIFSLSLGAIIIYGIVNFIKYILKNKFRKV